jgi:carboxylesterase type B
LSLGVPGKVILPDFVTWGPAIDGTLLNDRQPVTQGANLRVPMVLGTNSAEGILFELFAQGLPYETQLAALVGKDNVEKVKKVYPCKRLDCSSVAAQVFTDYIFACASRHLAIQAVGASRPRPVYNYEFTQVPSTNMLESVCACNGKVCHGAELPFVFNTFETRENEGNTADEERLSQTMGGYWTAFSTHHDPNGGGRPDWPLFSSEKKVVDLVQPPVVKTDPLATTAHCADLWDSIGYPAPGVHEALGNIH